MLDSQSAAKAARGRGHGGGNESLKGREGSPSDQSESQWRESSMGFQPMLKTDTGWKPVPQLQFVRGALVIIRA